MYFVHRWNFLLLEKVFVQPWRMKGFLVFSTSWILLNCSFLNFSLISFLFTVTLGMLQLFIPLSGIIYGHLVTIRLFITCIHFGGLRKFGVSPYIQKNHLQISLFICKKYCLGNKKAQFWKLVHIIRQFRWVNKDWFWMRSNV